MFCASNFDYQYNRFALMREEDPPIRLVIYRTAHFVMQLERHRSTDPATRNEASEELKAILQSNSMWTICSDILEAPDNDPAIYLFTAKCLHSKVTDCLFELMDADLQKLEMFLLGKLAFTPLCKEVAGIFASTFCLLVLGKIKLIGPLGREDLWRTLDFPISAWLPIVKEFPSAVKELAVESQFKKDALHLDDNQIVVMAFMLFTGIQSQMKETAFAAVSSWSARKFTFLGSVLVPELIRIIGNVDMEVTQFEGACFALTRILKDSSKANELAHSHSITPYSDQEKLCLSLILGFISYIKQPLINRTVPTFKANAIMRFVEELVISYEFFEDNNPWQVISAHLHHYLLSSQLDQRAQACAFLSKLMNRLKIVRVTIDQFLYLARWLSDVLHSGKQDNDYLALPSLVYDEQNNHFSQYRGYVRDILLDYYHIYKNYQEIGVDLLFQHIRTIVYQLRASVQSVAEITQLMIFVFDSLASQLIPNTNERYHITDYITDLFDWSDFFDSRNRVLQKFCELLIKVRSIIDGPLLDKTLAFFKEALQNQDFRFFSWSCYCKFIAYNQKVVFTEQYISMLSASDFGYQYYRFASMIVKDPPSSHSTAIFIALLDQALRRDPKKRLQSTKALLGIQQSKSIQTICHHIVIANEGNPQLLWSAFAFLHRKTAEKVFELDATSLNQLGMLCLNQLQDIVHAIVPPALLASICALLLLPQLNRQAESANSVLAKLSQFPGADILILNEIPDALLGLKIITSQQKQDIIQLFREASHDLAYLLARGIDQHMKVTALSAVAIWSSCKISLLGSLLVPQLLQVIDIYNPIDLSQLEGVCKALTRILKHSSKKGVTGKKHSLQVYDTNERQNLRCFITYIEINKGPILQTIQIVDDTGHPINLLIYFFKELVISYEFLEDDSLWQVIRTYVCKFITSKSSEMREDACYFISRLMKRLRAAKNTDQHIQFFRECLPQIVISARLTNQDIEDEESNETYLMGHRESVRGFICQYYEMYGNKEGIKRFFENLQPAFQELRQRMQFIYGQFYQQTGASIQLKIFIIQSLYRTIVWKSRLQLIQEIPLDIQTDEKYINRFIRSSIGIKIRLRVRVIKKIFDLLVHCRRIITYQSWIRISLKFISSYFSHKLLKNDAYKAYHMFITQNQNIDQIDVNVANQMDFFSIVDQILRYPKIIVQPHVKFTLDQILMMNHLNSLKYFDIMFSIIQNGKQNRPQQRTLNIISILYQYYFQLPKLKRQLVKPIFKRSSLQSFTILRQCMENLTNFYQLMDFISSEQMYRALKSVVLIAITTELSEKDLENVEYLFNLIIKYVQSQLSFHKRRPQLFIIMNDILNECPHQNKLIIANFIRNHSEAFFRYYTRPLGSTFENKINIENANPKVILDLFHFAKCLLKFDRILFLRYSQHYELFQFGFQCLYRNSHSKMQIKILQYMEVIFLSGEVYNQNAQLVLGKLLENSRCVAIYEVAARWGKMMLDAINYLSEIHHLDRLTILRVHIEKDLQLSTNFKAIICDYLCLAISYYCRKTWILAEAVLKLAQLHWCEQSVELLDKIQKRVERVRLHVEQSGPLAEDSESEDEI